MIQGGFDWNADMDLPISGRSPRARHASHSGAVRAAQDRPVLCMAYIALLRTLGPHTDQAAAKALGRETCSINSTRNGLGDRIVASGEFVKTTWGTKRTKWMVAK